MRTYIKHLFTSAALTLTLSACSQTSAHVAPDNPDNTENFISLKNDRVENSAYTMSRQTQQIYGPSIDAIKSFTPDLNIIFLTKSDFNFPTVNIMVFTNQGLRPMEAPSQDPAVKAAAFDSLSSVIYTACEKDAFLTKDIYTKEVLTQFSNYSGTLYGTILHLQSDAAGALSFSTHLGMSQNAGIMILPNEVPDLEASIRGLSGIPAIYFKDLNLTVEDYAIFMVAHEGVGHLKHQHISVANTPDYEMGYDAIHESWNHEGMADAFAAKVLDHNKGPIALNMINTVAALRAIGNFYLGEGALTSIQTSDINEHVTTLVYDPSQDNFISPKPHFQNPPEEAARVLTEMVSYADVLSAYMFLKDLREHEDYININNLWERTYFIDHLDTLMDFPEMVRGMAFIGSRLKKEGFPFGSHVEVAQDPQYFYAAMKYMRDNGFFDQYIETLEGGDEYQDIARDLLDDFFNAIDFAGGNPLTDPDAYEYVTDRLSNDLVSKIFTKTTENIDNDVRTEASIDFDYGTFYDVSRYGIDNPVQRFIQPKPITSPAPRRH